ncbi:transcription elongation factor Elf1 like-domain-containing protein [Zychaea mexicana]|uniref:transcription elongation factor Elf1 like-domain-containing protein n=1 Tax=Zychaea mexicana TaxID=64656 RepID=UPI0022FEBFE7|nr:transcription elongation factor Elf1 like-domain-containing protein [Zychaea mexicana]KAI9497025.1 transcription elongation factor Elf1 like-domain-containing protein [Zychaea mexicana]
MGKRKVKRQPQKKLKDKLDTHFNCLFCNHEKSIEVKLDRPNKVGHLSCKICDVNWQCTITYLDEGVDVYSAWVDACEDVNRGRREQKIRDRDRQRDQERDTEDEPRQRAAPAPAPAQSSRSSFANDGLDPFDEDDEDDEDY